LEGVVEEHGVFIEVPHCYADGSPEEGNVVESVLRYFSARKSKYSTNGVPRFFFCLIAAPKGTSRGSGIVKRNDECGLGRGGETDASNLVSHSFNVEGNGLGVVEVLVIVGLYVLERLNDANRALRAPDTSELRLSSGLFEVEDCDWSKVPLSEDGCWMISREAFDSIKISPPGNWTCGDDSATDFGDTLSSEQCPTGSITEEYADRGLHTLNFSEESVKFRKVLLTDILASFEGRKPADLSRSTKVFNVISRPRFKVKDVGEEALGPVDTGLAKHPREFVA